MKLVLTLLVALAVSLGLAIFLQQDPGRFVFTYAGVTVQTSFAFFIIALIILFGVFYFLIAFISDLVHLPKTIEKWSRHRRNRRSEKYLTQGILLSLEGNWSKAENAFRRGAPYSREPMLNYLGAARAAQQQAAVQRRDHYLRLAHEHSPESTLAVSLTQAELQLSQQQTEQAFATLKHLDTGRAGKNQVKLMLLEASAKLKEWRNMLDLIADISSSKLLPKENIRAKQLVAYAGLLRQAGESGDRLKLYDEWKRIPRKLQDDIHLIEVYVNECLKYSYSSNCELILKRALKKKWDHALVRLYGMVEGNDAGKQLAFAERMLATHARDVVLLLTLGRLCMRNGLWGKAKNYLQESIEIQPTAEAYQELALLLERQGNHETANMYYKKGLALATGNVIATSIKLSGQATNDVLSDNMPNDIL